ncbi:hypothetical protein MTO96_011847 [Rhipicephalus appendiculatus]
MLGACASFGTIAAADARRAHTGARAHGRHSAAPTASSSHRRWPPTCVLSAPARRPNMSYLISGALTAREQRARTCSSTPQPPRYMLTPKRKKYNGLRATTVARVQADS